MAVVLACIFDMHQSKKCTERKERGSRSDTVLTLEVATSNFNFGWVDSGFNRKKKSNGLKIEIQSVF